MNTLILLRMKGAVFMEFILKSSKHCIFFSAINGYEKEKQKKLLSE